MCLFFKKIISKEKDRQKVEPCLHTIIKEWHQDKVQNQQDAESVQTTKTKHK